MSKEVGELSCQEVDQVWKDCGASVSPANMRYEFARALQEKLASRFRAQGGNTSDNSGSAIANKAEVEQVHTADVDHFVKSSIRDFADFREDVERLSTTAHRATLKRIRKAIYDTIDARVRNSVIAALASRATPPATTGASTARDQALEEAARLSEEMYESGEGGAGTKEAAARIRALKGSVGASTVLTDERKYTQADMERYALLVRDAAIEREVAAQAGQVAVPTGFDILPLNATAEMIEAAESVGDLYRMGRPELWGQVWKAMLAAAPSPAKESK